jgi:tetratricopeptide (TPR) repeat protein
MTKVLLALFLMGLQVHPDVSRPSQVHQYGLTLFRQQKYADAIQALREAIKTEHTNTTEYGESALLIGQSYYLLRQASEAIPWLERVTSVNEANYMLGCAYLQIGLPDRSETAFARLFDIKPDTAKAHLIAGQMMLKEEYQIPALAEVTKAVTLDPNIPRGHFVLGEIAIYRGAFSDAVTHLRRELRLDPNYAMAWYRLGDAYVRQQNCELAIPSLQRAVWLDSGYSGPYILLAKCYSRQRNYSNAERFLRGALKVDPNNREAIYLLGQTLMASGRQTEGRAVLDRLAQFK